MKTKFCETEGCLNVIKVHPKSPVEKKYCAECLRERTKRRKRKYDSDLRNGKRKKSRRNDKGYWEPPESNAKYCEYVYPDGHVCGKKLADLNKTNQCFCHPGPDGFCFVSDGFTHEHKVTASAQMGPAF